jgi:hypothetical protein
VIGPWIALEIQAVEHLPGQTVPGCGIDALGRPEARSNYAISISMSLRCAEKPFWRA